MKNLLYQFRGFWEKTLKKVPKRIFYPFFFYENWRMGLGHRPEAGFGDSDVISGIFIFFVLAFSAGYFVYGGTLVPFAILMAVVYVIGQIYHGKSAFFDYITATIVCFMGLVLLVPVIGLFL